MQQNLYLGLVHYPINNKRGEVVTTSVTNLDIHDISRSCRTFGVEKYFIITPLKAQHELVNRILGHWQDDKSSAYNPDRKDALALATLANSIEDATLEIEQKEGVRPLIAITGANFEQNDGDASQLKSRISLDNKPVFLLFGTGWGLISEVVETADFRLRPILGSASDGYNHLSVRSAVAIYLANLKEGNEKD